MSSAGRLSGLDGLRGVAALVVVVHHSLLTMSGFAAVYWGLPFPTFVAPFAYTPLHVLWAGGEAVLVFFVLSGVVLTLPSSRGRAIPWRAYYPSRLVRLYLPVVAAVLCAVGFALLWPRTADAGYGPWMQSHDEPLTFSSVARNMVLVTGTSWLDSPLWSLRWEVIFSLLLPVYVFVARRWGRRWWLPIAVLLGGCAVTGNAIGSDALHYLPFFGFGALLAVLREDLQRVGDLLFARKGGRVLEVSVVVLASVLVTTSWWGPRGGRTVSGIEFAAVVLGVVLIVGLAIAGPGTRRVLSGRGLVWMGAVSFSLYLTHEPIVVSIALIAPRDSSWITPLVTIPIALGFAWVFWRLIESPAHRLARSLGDRLAQSGRSRTIVDPPVSA